MLQISSSATAIPESGEEDFQEQYWGAAVSSITGVSQRAVLREVAGTYGAVCACGCPEHDVQTDKK